MNTGLVKGVCNSDPHRIIVLDWKFDINNNPSQREQMCYLAWLFFVLENFELWQILGPIWLVIKVMNDFRLKRQTARVTVDIQIQFRAQNWKVENNTLTNLSLINKQTSMCAYYWVGGSKPVCRTWKTRGPKLGKLALFTCFFNLT